MSGGGERPPATAGGDGGEADDRAPLARLRRGLELPVALAFAPFVLLQVNHPTLTPQGQLAVFAALGLALAFLRRPPAGAGAGRAAGDLLLALLALGCGLWFALQTEPATSGLWLDGLSLGDRAGAERPVDFAVGAVLLLLVLEAARRTLGLVLPLLSLAFVAYAALGPELPAWLLPHRGYPTTRILGQTVLQSQGIFGLALRVMFTYVVPFVFFGTLLEATGTTGWIVGLSRRLFRRGVGSSAKVAVLSSGLLGSLSGSAMANTATTGTFTIPMMRSAGFSPRLAAGVEAAASSGGALVPPVMGAGAYMMLEIVQPPVTYLEIVRAALLPALLYYVSLFLGVHFRALRLAAEGGGEGEGGTEGGGDGAPTDDRGERGGRGVDAAVEPPRPGGGTGGDRAPATGATTAFLRFEGLLFAASLAVLLERLVAGASVPRAVTWSIAAVALGSLLRRRTRLGPRRALAVLLKAARASIALVAAATSVGIILGVVTLTGIGTRLPALLVPLAQGNLLGALALLMVSSLILGMGLPSAVCYLLLATLVGPVLGDLGIPPLAGHLFIFYFGMMSMVTPPVALAAYAASSIAGSPFLATSVAAFRYALVGFTLPYLFVYRPQLLGLAPGGGLAGAGPVVLATVLALLGIVPLAASVAGWLAGPLGPGRRALLALSAILALLPGRGPIFGSSVISIWNLAGIVLLAAIVTLQRRRRRAGTARAGGE